VGFCSPAWEHERSLEREALVACSGRTKSVEKSYLALLNHGLQGEIIEGRNIGKEKGWFAPQWARIYRRGEEVREEKWCWWRGASDAEARRKNPRRKEKKLIFSAIPDHEGRGGEGSRRENGRPKEILMKKGTFSWEEFLLRTDPYTFQGERAAGRTILVLPITDRDLSHLRKKDVVEEGNKMLQQITRPKRGVGHEKACHWCLTE